MKQLEKLKFMVMALFIAMVGVSLTACSDDDDDNNGGNNAPSLVGTWENNEGYRINGHANTVLKLEFKSNGKGSLTAVYTDGTDPDTYNFDYTTTVDRDNDLVLKIVWTTTSYLIYDDDETYYPTVTQSRLKWGDMTYVRK